MIQGNMAALGPKLNVWEMLGLILSPAIVAVGVVMAPAVAEAALPDLSDAALGAARGAARVADVAWRAALKEYEGYRKALTTEDFLKITVKYGWKNAAGVFGSFVAGQVCIAKFHGWAAAACLAVSGGPVFGRLYTTKWAMGEVPGNITYSWPISDFFAVGGSYPFCHYVLSRINLC
jgi:hypothetical protein